MARPYYKLLDKSGKPIKASAVRKLLKSSGIRTVAADLGVTTRTLYMRFGDEIRGLNPVGVRRKPKTTRKSR